jgi:hypoxanthine phosphoribosyltransferase
MLRIQLNNKQFELFVTEERLSEAIAGMAVKIKEDIDLVNPLFIGILNGAFMFIADLMRHLNGPYELTFARYLSYRGTASSGRLQEIMPVSADVRGRNLILLEDIVDSGYTMYCLKSKFMAGGANEVRVATMLFKPAALQYDAKPDYAAMEIPNDFIVGHGLDYDGMGRAYRDIYRIVNN